MSQFRREKTWRRKKTIKKIKIGAFFLILVMIISGIRNTKKAEAFNEVEVLDDLKSYHQAFDIESTDDILKHMYFESNAKQYIKDWSYVYDSKWDNIEDWKKTATGVNVYINEYKPGELPSIVILYALEESKTFLKKNGSKVESKNIITMNQSEMVYDNDTWKIKSTAKLENIMVDGVVNTEYAYNNNELIVDYIDWYLNTESVQVEDKLFYAILAGE